MASNCRGGPPWPPQPPENHAGLATEGGPPLQLFATVPIDEDGVHQELMREEDVHQK
jgi:hypothetical protein